MYRLFMIEQQENSVITSETALTTPIRARNILLGGEGQ
jgi:hypothetical protein